MSSGFKIPVYLLVMDGIGSILAVLGILGALELNIGLPAIFAIWPFLLVLGFGLMIPMIFWILKLVRGKR